MTAPHHDRHDAGKVARSLALYAAFVAAFVTLAAYGIALAGAWISLGKVAISADPTRAILGLIVLPLCYAGFAFLLVFGLVWRKLILPNSLSPFSVTGVINLAVATVLAIITAFGAYLALGWAYRYSLGSAGLVWVGMYTTIFPLLDRQWYRRRGTGR